MMRKKRYNRIKTGLWVRLNSAVKKKRYTLRRFFLKYTIKLYNLYFALVLIDKVLEEDDLNNDGYLEYVEYVLGRQRDHVAQEKRDKLRIGT